MAIGRVLIAALAMAAAPALASQETAPPAGAPEASADALYCLWVEPTLGTRIETVQCYTREQWTEFEVDVDKEWAKEGVRVVEASHG